MAEGVEKLKRLLNQADITEIMINGPKATFLEINGIKHKVDLVFTEEDIKEVIEEYFNKAGKQISYYNPFGDVALPDGSRMNIITYPLARCGTTITIRKFDRTLKSLDDLVNRGTLSKRWLNF